ncbi:MAG: RNB domain-containing ribonuclease [Solirubrobacterales bacterium]
MAGIERRGRFEVAEPLFERGPQVTLERGRVKVRSGDIALVDFGSRGARVVRALGSAERARDVVDALLWDRGTRRGFPRAVEEEAADAVVAATELPTARRNLTDLPTFTVDPATARDFDDAVSTAPEGDGIRLWIHIADVSAHVRPGTRLDSEALRRGTSTYVPGSVEPMLPRVLSDEACSLSPGVERLAVTAEIVLGARGEPRSASFYRSRIRSDARLDYDQLDEIFAGRQHPPQAVRDPIDLARRAAAALAARRPVGSLEIESFEPEFAFDDDGQVVGAHSVPQTEAHKLIEHLMILTNEQVAELCERRKAPTVYRVHEQPDPRRVERLAEQLASLGVPTPPVPDLDDMSPTQAGELVGDISRLVAKEAARRGYGRDAYTSLVLRSLKQAYYADRNLGHAGLGSTAYAHFTSPIRRYPDLVAHRALLSAVGAGEAEPEDVRDAAVQSSEREREATAIERDADSVCSSFLLGRELFERGWKRAFEGEVSGVIGAGAFVRFGGELGDVYEGLMPVRLMRSDHFDLNETETALVGRSSGSEIKLGDPLTVRVDRVEAPRGRVDLVPAEEAGSRQGARRDRRRERR